MSDARTVREALAGDDDAIAFAAPDRDALTYAGLRDLVESTAEALNSRGIGRGDRVAIVLPNGPEMASAFVSIASAATTAPLNPAYREAEYDFYLADLGAKALVVLEGSDSEAVTCAARLGIPVLELRIPAGAPAGRFELTGDGTTGAADGGWATADDVALVLHTSGTTSRPKIVPLAHRNVCASAANIRATLGLGADDRCMNVMPLFHIHGLMAATLAPLGAGASIYCTPGFNALRFFSWLDDARPTYYTAVPTMHQAILTRAERNRDVIERAALRFIRSSSSSLPPQVMAELESVFGAPVVEAYAMTEASHQMTCNPLPPGERKPGTVGPAAGPDVAIMNEAGALLEAGEVGEIVIRGPNVTDGYENNPTANAEAFTSGWFRTGDQGVMDAEGYVTITGRLKEIINRGGEKISPREVDDALMDHPAIQQIVTFAVPHERLGEEVAAACVLRDGAEATPEEIREFAGACLASFKVPKTVLILDEIPKGPTGKLRRIGMAEQLGLA
ncbi:MAG: acyl--CoA ligase [Gemmatimonadota bacterium]|nr:acyl--CoA ligase [Gemmatimonadota bacterium]